MEKTMKIECGYCGESFVLEEKCVKKEIAEEDPLVMSILQGFGMKMSKQISEYWLVCPCCNKKIGKFEGYLL